MKHMGFAGFKQLYTQSQTDNNQQQMKNYNKYSLGDPNYSIGLAYQEGDANEQDLDL